MSDRTTTVKIPKELADRIDGEVLGHYGYTSRSEVVTDAVEEFLKGLRGRQR